MKNLFFKPPFFSSLFFFFIIIIGALAFKAKEKVKIGFLVHDMVSERWKQDVGFFSNEIEALGGEIIVKNAFGDANVQVNQGKMLINDGVKVLVVVAQDGNILSELVDYADKRGVKIIAYDRMINNCNLHYYLSYDNVRVGELMAEHAIKLKPQGNYVLLYGPSSDNNALLVKKGIMNVLKKSTGGGKIKIIMEKEFDTWYGLDSYIFMDEFLSSQKLAVDVIIASNDDLASGAVDAVRMSKRVTPVITGQDASVEASKNILQGYQSMTVYKSIQRLSKEAAVLAMKVAANDKIVISKTIHNGSFDIPSILFDPISVNRSNLKEVLFAEGHVKEADLK